MSNYYNPQRSRNIYDPNSTKPFKISRSKLDLFIKCPRCFYLDRRLGVGQPPGYPFNLNSAVDALLKKEFDYYRQLQEPHPLLIENEIDAIPFQHPHIETWRDSLHHGIQYAIPDTNIILTGGVDDIWINSKSNKLIIVDYKATSKSEPVSLDAPWQIGYKRQAEIYQWLFKMNGFDVMDTAYFVYCNGKTNNDRFDSKLLFEISVLPYVGNTEWVEQTALQAFQCLCADTLPMHAAECDFCRYTIAINNVITDM